MKHKINQSSSKFIHINKYPISGSLSFYFYRLRVCLNFIHSDFYSQKSLKMNEKESIIKYFGKI
ncbi:hypothetical protein M2451_000578 [Dysgonomonas sp. PFB1-18]|nr:hypothetical protein [Dysgonomonas sp. PF1-14]MDH6337347.1 hypothetical protein [Dysgonomonas sp. PF1-16]MDH6379271.1 hypothetical protein [Dysgonomonas sp. PFB1-18]MDH6396091.1 hypothetical protein [Dysgonomonas sp. PF1-23]